MHATSAVLFARYTFFCVHLCGFVLPHLSFQSRQILVQFLLISSRRVCHLALTISPSLSSQVESVKAASDVYSPVGGKVAEINAKLKDEPSLLNKSPYDGMAFSARTAWNHASVSVSPSWVHQPVPRARDFFVALLLTFMCQCSPQYLPLHIDSHSVNINVTRLYISLFCVLPTHSAFSYRPECARVRARCCADAWLVKLQNVSDADVAKLMDHAAYEKHCKDSAH